MSTAAPSRRFSPADLLTLPDAGRFELVGGELVERNMGYNAVLCGSRLYWFLMLYCQTHPEMLVVPADASYQCFPDSPDKVRRPDLSCIDQKRLPSADKRVGHCRVAPDLAVEVISPGDLYYEVEVKVGEYLRAGVRLVWVVNPATKTIRVHHPGGEVMDLGETDELGGEQVLPGFRCRVGDVFLLPSGEPIA